MSSHQEMFKYDLAILANRLFSFKPLRLLLI